MSSDVIGSRYRLGSVVTCTPEATTWDARDTWLDQRVLIVTPEPGCDRRFTALASAVVDRSSSHLVGLYDIGSTADEFVVFGVPAATLSDELAPREEEDVLVAGRALGDALEALHERGVVHGDLHPGSVVMAESGDAALSPWPLAPRPHNWSGPGGFGTDPDEPRDVSARDDVRALGAVLLGALAGPPVLSSEQVGNIERELAGRAPHAVAIADRALTPPAGGGYAVAAELRDDCAAVLAGRPVASVVPDLVAAADGANTAGTGSSAASEGRRAALVLATSGAALFAGFGVAGSIGAGPRTPVHPVAAHPSSCVARADSARCTEPTDTSTAATAARPASGAPARLADNSAAVPPARGSGSTATAATSTTPTGVIAPRPPASTTTAPPSTTTSSAPTTTTSAPPTTTTAPSTTTTTPPPTTTSTSYNVMQAGPSGGSASWSGPGTGSGSGQGWGR
jgi:eukaryotic-like serine/threonine-protein kinase